MRPQWGSNRWPGGSVLSWKAIWLKWQAFLSYSCTFTWLKTHCDKCAVVTCLSSPTSPPPCHPSISHRRLFFSKARVISGVFVRQKALFSHWVILACIFAYSVTNRTTSFIWDCQIFLTSIDIKSPCHYCPEDWYFSGTLQSAASQNPSHLFADWY